MAPITVKLVFALDTISDLAVAVRRSKAILLKSRIGVPPSIPFQSLLLCNIYNQVSYTLFAEDHPLWHLL
jgi:hypothetical protein